MHADRDTGADGYTDTDTVDQSGSIVDPAHDIVPGANRNLFGINTGVAIVGPQGGAAFCPLDHPLVSLGAPILLEKAKEVGGRVSAGAEELRRLEQGA